MAYTPPRTAAHCDLILRLGHREGSGRADDRHAGLWHLPGRGGAARARARGADGVHKSVGVLVLILGGLRVAWRLWQGALPEAGHAQSWQAVYYVLLAGIVVMPFYGLIGSYFGGRATCVFGLFGLLAGSKSEWLGNLAYGFHGAGAMVLIAAILLHVAGALKHHFLDRNATLLRMGRQGLIPRRKRKPRCRQCGSGVCPGCQQAGISRWLRGSCRRRPCQRPHRFQSAACPARPTGSSR